MALFRSPSIGGLLDCFLGFEALSQKIKEQALSRPPIRISAPPFRNPGSMVLLEMPTNNGFPLRETGA